MDDTFTASLFPRASMLEERLQIRPRHGLICDGGWKFWIKILCIVTLIAAQNFVVLTILSIEVVPKEIPVRVSWGFANMCETFVER